MSREIKFRVWDKGTLKMSEPFDLFGEFTMLGAVHDWQTECAGFGVVGGSLERLNDLEIMQYTDLKDKTGKEIFEGDIIKWSSTHKGADGGEHIDVIEWQNENACFLLMPFVHEPYAAEMEVVGNIYQNPELLKP